MNNLILRSITGIGIGLVIIGGIAISQYTFMIVFLLLLIAGLIEFYQIFEKKGFKPQKISGIILGILVFGLNYIIATGYMKYQLIIIIIPIVLYIVIAELFRKHTSPFENISITIFGILYIAVPIALFWQLAYRDNIYLYNPHFLLAYFIIIWTYDTGAYLIGVNIGKRKLFERISPKKSWEGAIGGYIISLGIAYLISFYYKELTSYQWIIFGSIVAIFGTFGDLIESMFKRSLDIKDSGNILPGHGGILDRFDALFLAIPAVYVYLQFI